MTTTKIEWTDETWNPIRGCSRVSEGCRNCYAEKIAYRFSGPGQPYEGLIAKTGQWNGNITLVPEKLAEPLHWKKPRRVFVNSMSDLFHENVPFEFIASVFAIMGVTTRHTYQILTKRPERMLAFFDWALSWEHKGNQITMEPGDWGADDKIQYHWPKEIPWQPLRKGQGGYDNCGPLFPYENVWLGVSVEDQKTADERIPLLLKTPAAIRFISAEPLLSAVSIATTDYSDGIICDSWWPIDWVIVGGESGPGARPMHPDWVRSIRDQCFGPGVPFFFKQWGDYDLSYDRDRDDPDFKQCQSIDRYPGRWINLAGGHGFHGERVHYARKVGKKKAGRTLDGRTWSQYPGDK